MNAHKFLSVILLSAATTAMAGNEDVRYEAEDGNLVNCEYSTGSQYSGGKAVKMTKDNASMTLNVTTSEKQRCKLIIKAEGIGGEKTINCSVNGVSISFKANALSEIEVGTFQFKPGNNQVKITPNWTWFNIDYIRLEAGDEVIPFSISASPITAEATTSAHWLYTFLYRNFGKRTVSGIMCGSMDNTSGANIKTQEDVKAVYNASGYYPALVGFDFMNATGIENDKGNDWFNQYTRTSVALAKDLWQKGGIPDFTWHWRDPSRTTGDFSSSKAKFNFTTAMNADGTWNTQSALYKHLINDIDVVADYFLELQNAGVACIFRPLHEASGGWFWWGTQGPEAFKKLYRLVYDEITHVKGAHNIIWDWNADYTLGDLWCPGEEYYDIISTDIYNNAYDYSSNYPAFFKLLETSQGKKIITLAENGPIPDIDNMVEEDAMWSWWMPWYQSWDGGYVDKTSREEWKKCMSDSRIITLSDMPGWNDDLATPQLSQDASSSPITYYNLLGQPLKTAPRQGLFIKNK